MMQKTRNSEIIEIIDKLRNDKIHQSTKKITTNDLFILYDLDNDLIKFLIKSPENFKKSSIPSWKGVDFDYKTRNNIPFVELSISDDVDNDKIFKELINRIVEDQEDIKGNIEAFDCFLNTLNSFDAFFKNQRKGLSKYAQQGLYAELFFLRNHVFPNCDIISHAINSWHGPEKAHQDFVFENGNVEVKSTMQKDTINISITNEKQLDPRPLESINNKLMMYVLCLDDITPKNNTLPDLISEIHNFLDHHNSADKTTFNSRLNSVGYFDYHAELYLDRGYFIRKELFYEIKSDIYFPSIIDLPNGVGDVRYSIDLSACNDSLIDLIKIKEVL